MGSRNVPDRNKVFFGIPNVDFNTEIDYARDEAIKDLERKNQELQAQLQTFVPAAEVVPPSVIGGLVIEATRPSGLPADGMQIGNGIYAVSNSTTVDLMTSCVFDPNGGLGLGDNVYVGIKYIQNSNIALNDYEVIAYNPSTTAVTSLSFPAPTSTTIYRWQLLIVEDLVNGSNLYLKRIHPTTVGGAEDMYVWNFSTGWSTVSGGTGYGYMSTMEISGDEHLVVTASISATRVVGYIDPATPDTLVSTGVTLAAGEMIHAKKDYMWTSLGYRANASTSPTFANVVPTMSYGTEFFRGQVDVDYVTGDLCVLVKFGTPSRYGIESYAFTNGIGTLYPSLFTATGDEDDGEPRANYLNLYADDGVYAIAGFLSEDYINLTTGGSKYVPAVWISDGLTTTLVASDITYTNSNSFVGMTLKRDISGILGVNIAINYGIKGSPTVSTIDVLQLAP